MKSFRPRSMSAVRLAGPLIRSFGKSTCVISPVTTIREPKPKRVRNIFICCGVVFWASSRITNASFKVQAPHKSQGRNLNYTALQMGLKFGGVYHLVKGIVQRPEVRVHFRHNVPGQKPERFSGLYHRTGQYNPRYFAPVQTLRPPSATAR